MGAGACWCLTAWGGVCLPDELLEPRTWCKRKGEILIRILIPYFLCFSVLLGRVLLVHRFCERNLSSGKDGMMTKFHHGTEGLQKSAIAPPGVWELAISALPVTHRRRIWLSLTASVFSCIRVAYVYEPAYICTWIMLFNRKSVFRLFCNSPQEKTALWGEGGLLLWPYKATWLGLSAVWWLSFRNTAFVDVNSWLVHEHMRRWATVRSFFIAFQW